MTDLFTKLQTVAIPVADQDRTKALLEDLGFTTTMDQELQPGFRWVELASPTVRERLSPSSPPAMSYRRGSTQASAC